MAPGIAPSKGHGWGHFLPLRTKKMVTVFNSPALFFVIEIATEENQPLAWYSLDQAVPKPCSPREEDRVYDQVRADLDGLETRTGLTYKIRYWGSLEGRKAYVKHYNLTLS